MQKWQVYPTLLAVLFFTLSVACTAPVAAPPTISQKPASFEVGSITVSPDVVMVGDTVTLSTTVKNTGDVAGSYTAALLVDGQQAGSKDISINPGSSLEVTFDLSETKACSYHISVGSSSTVLTFYNWMPYAIQYDNSDEATGSAYGSEGLNGIYVSDDQGHIIRFTPPNKAFKIQKIKVLGTVRILNTSDFDKNHVTVNIWDTGGNRIWSQDLPWRFFEGSAIWREISVPDIRVNGDFYVELVTHSYPAAYRSDGAIIYGGDPIEFVQLAIPSSPFIVGLPPTTPLNIVIIGFDYPQSYINSPVNRLATRSGYSYTGKLIDPGQKRLEGINWLIRVEGDGAPPE